VGLGPSDTVAKNALLSAWQTLRSFLLGQIVVLRELIGQIAHTPILAITQTPEQREHDGLKVWNSHNAT
jgi:hypothetical protein